MASPPSPVPARSPEKKADVNLRHPVPDLQSLQGAYVGNIERLEEHAERMSEPGSDLGEEIRKLHSELKLSDSRRSSLRSIPPSDEPTRQYSTRSRNVSTSSHANSIVDVNGNARWGGYSPGGYVTSPVGSLRSTSWTNPTPSIQRQRSESKASRLGQVVRPEDVEDDPERSAAYPESPKSLRSAPLANKQRDSPPPQELRKVSSFTRIYDEIANGLPEDLRNSVVLGQQPPSDEAQHADDAHYPRYREHQDFPDRPPTAASTDTTHQARTLWQDFDGTHCPDTVIEEPEPSQSGHSRHSSGHSLFMMRSNPELPLGPPPPEENMVFYPAPVPRMLNLPKRLSQLPASDVQARRRTQLLESMQIENRKSAPLLGEMVGDETIRPNNRKSRQSLMGLPPQLRASAYFDQVAPTQEFAVKGESAEDTLESILDASARAPVSAFTDHPFTGQSGRAIYAPEHKRQTSKLPEVPPTLEQTRRRSSFNILDTNNKSSGEPLNKLKKRNSSADMNLLIVKASESRMSLGAELDEHDEHARGPSYEDDHNTPTRRSFDEEGRNPDDVYAEQALEEEEPEEHEEEQHYGAPTTLLAELQLRKAKQKTRTVNYATLVQNGAINDRRTLLQMDDQAEKEKQKRIKRKVQLAWEAQQEEEDSDDDVPLGVLYHPGGAPQRQEPHRPLGLFEQRELEDNEPLSRRRNRLRGIDPNMPRDVSPNKRNTSQMHLAVPTSTTPGPESEEDEGETLGERMRRLKDKQMLSAALGDDVRKSTVSGDFAAEMLSKLGGTDVDEDKTAPPQPTPSPGAEEEETLGQRRARLQAEAAARGEAAPAARPALRSSGSLADLLAANPVNNNNQARKISNELLVSHLPNGSLLQRNEVAEERRKAQRLTQNMRASSFGTQLLPTAMDKNDDDVPLAAKIQEYKNIMKGTPAANNAQMPMMGMNNMGMMMPGQRESFMPGMMGMNGMGMMSQPNFGMMQQQSMMMGMQQPQIPMGGFQYPQNPGMSMRQSSNPMMMNGVGGMQMPMGNMPMGMNGVGMGGPGVNMMMPPMDPRQRDQIDRWMQGIRH